jgi:hypothetical protein
LNLVHGGYCIQYLGLEHQWIRAPVNSAFFPLYPYATKVLGWVRLPGGFRPFGLQNPTLSAGLVLSNLSLFFSLIYLLRIARMYLDEDAVQRSLVYLLAFPTSFFFSAYYTEGLFLLTTTASFYHFLKGQHARAGFWGFLATMTRSPGLMLLPAFVAGHLWQRRGKVSRSDLSLAWLGLIPCGLGVVMFILYRTVGDPLAFTRAHAFWGRSYLAPHLTIWRTLLAIDWTFPLRDHGNTVRAIDLLSSLVFLGLPLLLLRGFHRALPIYALLLIVMPLSTGTVLSMLRCEVVAFPSFFALARLGKNRSVDRWIIYASTLFLVIFKLCFGNGRFVE